MKCSECGCGYTPNLIVIRYDDCKQELCNGCKNISERKSLCPKCYKYYNGVTKEG
jgi:hypothetical protein